MEQLREHNVKQISTGCGLGYNNLVDLSIFRESEEEVKTIMN